MIYVRDKGRLCNNILQYGHVYAWGREHGRQTVSMRFAYKYQFFRICHTRHHHFLNYFLAKTAARWGLLPVATFDTPDEDTSRQEQLMLSHRHIVAEGWYARWYDLFLKYKHEIVDLFAFDQKVKTRPDALMASLPACDIRLGVHVRRGDYKTWHFIRNRRCRCSSVAMTLRSTERHLPTNCHKHSSAFPTAHPAKTSICCRNATG